VLLDGVRDVELSGHVRITRPGQQLNAGKARLIHGPEDRLRQALVTDRVSGNWVGGEDGPGTLRTDQLDMRWDALGEIEFLGLTGDALLSLGPNSLTAATIEVARHNGGQEWKVHADRDVYVQGRFGDAPGLAARYERGDEFLAAIFHKPVQCMNQDSNRALPCVVGEHRGRKVSVGDWSMVHVTDPTTCHCVLSRLDEAVELPLILDAVAPGLEAAASPQQQEQG